MIKSSKSGFSLVELMIVAGLVGGLALVVMQVLKSSSKGQVDVQNFADYSSLRNEANFLISSPNSCKASLGGMTFKGSTIKNTPVTGVELWSSNQAGARSTKKFYGSAKFGKLEIESISLLMPDYTAGTNWVEGIDQTFTAELKISGKKSSMGSTKSFNDITKPIHVTFDTDSSGVSKIKDCTTGSTSTSGAGSFNIWGASTCPAAFETVKSGKVFASAMTSVGNGGADMVCSSGPNTRKLYVVNAARTGYQWENPMDCAVCSPKGARFCFTNYGGHSCPTGFSAAYTGKMFQLAWNSYGTSGKLICKQGNSNNGVYIINPSVSAYEWIEGESCAECCRD